MSELEALASRAKDNNDLESGLLDAREKSMDIADEALRKAALDITQTIRSEAVTKDTKSIKKTVIDFLKEQFNRFSHAVLAMLLATFVALIMPFLVKLELVDDFNQLSASLSSAIASNQPDKIFQSTLEINEKTDAIEQQNTEMMSAFAQLESMIYDVKLGSDDTKVLELIAALESSLNIQNQKLTSLSKSINDIADKTQSTSYVEPARLKNKIAGYIATGNQLVIRRNEKLDAVNDINSWIGEVYFFVGIIPSSTIELDEVRSVLKSIHAGEKPYLDQYFRVSQTLLVLKAIQSWISV